MKARVLLFTACVAAAAGSIAWAAIPGLDGAINGCYGPSGLLRVISVDKDCRASETPIVWNQVGQAGATGEQGPQGPAGPAGPAGNDGAAGPPGLSDAFSVEENDEVEIPIGAPTTLLTLSGVPAGKYVILANVVAHNINTQSTVPVNCYLGQFAENSPPYSARIDPFSSAGAIAGTASGASTATIALTLTTQLLATGAVTLRCQSNTGFPGRTAIAGTRQITAIKVGNLSETDLAP